MQQAVPGKRNGDNPECELEGAAPSDGMSEHGMREERLEKGKRSFCMCIEEGRQGGKGEGTSSTGRVDSGKEQIDTCAYHYVHLLKSS